MKLSKSTTVFMTHRWDVPADAIESIIKNHLGLGDRAEGAVEFEWDISTDSMVRGLTVTFTEQKEDME